MARGMKLPKRKRLDVNQLAHTIVQQATKDEDEQKGQEGAKPQPHQARPRPRSEGPPKAGHAE